MNSNYVELTDIFPEMPQKLEKNLDHIELLENLDNTINEKTKIIYNWSKTSVKYLKIVEYAKHKYTDFINESTGKGMIILSEAGYNVDELNIDGSIIPEEIMQGTYLDLLKNQHTIYLFLSNRYQNIDTLFKEHKDSLQESIDLINDDITNSNKSIETRKSHIFDEQTKDAQTKYDNASAKYKTLLAENKKMSNALSVLEECFEWKDMRKMFMWHKLPEKTKTNLDFFSDSARVKYSETYSSMSLIKNAGKTMSMDKFYEVYQMTKKLEEPRKNLEQSKINAEKYINTDFLKKDEQTQILNEKIKTLQKEKKEHTNKIGKINNYMQSTEKTFLKINRDINNIYSEFNSELKGDDLKENIITLNKKITQAGILQTMNEFIDTCPYKKPIENTSINPNAITQSTLQICT
ncbi:MAG: hypothetical protein KAI53_02295 [Candidatus Aenigmarchaeota archaeon]|nr:hypothetical protein [Candidatus Aenigmarchaeota archaeon]